ncbi:hypothetical protein RZE82_02805 [Mollicutes bacterium LVI A0039]|nr:hypothetical protein RZE82_02805 [Mollicutes bacterium LVI A0039]
MELRLEYKGKVSTVNLDKINLIYGRNKTGKTEALKLLVESFKGNLNYSLINGMDIPHGMFNVIFIEDTRDIDAEVGLKAKSNFHNYIVKRFINEEYDLLKKLTQNFAGEVNEALVHFEPNQYKYALSDNKISINSKKLEKLETILFELISLDQHSMSSKEEFYFYQCLDQVKDGMQNILVIDDVDRYLDSNVLAKFIKHVSSFENLTILITSKNKYLINDLILTKYIDPNLNVVDLVPFAKEEMFRVFLEKEEVNTSLDKYIMLNEKFYEKNDYEKHLKDNCLKIIEKITE